jgi:hypothetical protein
MQYAQPMTVNSEGYERQEKGIILLLDEAEFEIIYHALHLHAKLNKRSKKIAKLAEHIRNLPVSSAAFSARRKLGIY